MAPRFYKVMTAWSHSTSSSSAMTRAKTPSSSDLDGGGTTSIGRSFSTKPRDQGPLCPNFQPHHPRPPPINAGRSQGATTGSPSAWILASCGPVTFSLSMARWWRADSGSPRPFADSGLGFTGQGVARTWTFSSTDFDSCTTKKGPTRRSHAPIQQNQVGSPMERMDVDLLDPFPHL